MDEAGHVLDVQVERVMRASVARLEYEWRRTKKREKQLAGTLLYLSHELQSCPSRGGSAGGRTWPDSCSFCDCWCGLSGGLLGAQCRVSRGRDSGAGAAGVCGGQFGGQSGGEGPVACAA